VVHSDVEATIPEARRVLLSPLGRGFYRAIVHSGFMEHPPVHAILTAATTAAGVRFVDQEVTYYLGRETILATSKGRMGRLAESLYSYLQRNAVAADRHFGIPPEQVVEIGTQIDL
jgi:KUP system potassium uptake protein